MRKYLLGVIGAAIVASLPVSVMAQAGPQPHNNGQHKEQPQQPKKSQSKSPYGEWKTTWGKAPPTPPKHWTKTSDWHRHVRACQQRYKSYNAKTDTFRTNSGKNSRCKL